MSHSHLLVLFLLTVQSLFIFDCKEYNQSDFGIDHLVMSTFKAFSCVVRRGYLLDHCILLAKLCQPLLCFILYSKIKLACYSGYLLTSYFCIPVPYNEKDIFFGCQVQKVLQVFTEPFNFSFLSITGEGIDLDYRDIEWFALEMNRDHSVVFEIASKSCILDSC